MPAAPNAVAPRPSPPGELRCGWFENPTPGNAWLTDRHGQWLVGAQGGHQAEGDWPQFGRQRWVRTNGHYGHGCACMRVRTQGRPPQPGSASNGAGELLVLQIYSARSRPLSVCRQDRHLPKPDLP
jgi:hypothetical protein